MIIVDVETTGINPEKHSLLSIGAIDFNNPENRFSIECSAFPGAHADDEALLITGHTRENIFDETKPSENEAIKKFALWVKTVSDHTVAGQNPQFDVSFLLAAANRAGENLSLPHRIIDLHSIVWFHLVRNGHNIPLLNNRSNINSDFITTYVGIPNEFGPHVGMQGALWEAEAFSRLFYDKNLLSEFSEFGIPWRREGGLSS